jgi:DNA-binding transcriptional MerR regulator
MDTRGTPAGPWSIGELACWCGVTVRTLRHYDRLGLVVPSERTAAGHRRYSERELRRLYRVLVLRRLGLGLAAIAEWLETDSDADLLALMRRHLDSVDRQLSHQEQLRDRLVRTLDLAERTHDGPASRDLIAIVEMMSMYDDHLTVEQLARLEQDRRELGFPGIEPWRAEAEAAMSAFGTAYESGADPGDPHVQDLVRQIRDLRHQFAGSDHAIGDALQGIHGDTQWDAIRALIPQDAELRVFWKRARNAAST